MTPKEKFNKIKLAECNYDKKDLFAYQPRVMVIDFEKSETKTYCNFECLRNKLNEGKDEVRI